MIRDKFLVTVLAGSSLFIAEGAFAQWLNPTLDAQRWDNLRRHQQQQARQAADGNNQARPAAETSPPLTRAERKAAWTVYEAEYQRRVTRDGHASADRWFEERARAMKAGS